MGTKHWERGQLLGKRRITPCHMKSGVNIIVTQKFEPTHAPCQDKERALHYCTYRMHLRNYSRQRLASVFPWIWRNIRSRIITEREQTQLGGVSANMFIFIHRFVMWTRWSKHGCWDYQQPPNAALMLPTYYKLCSENNTRTCLSMPCANDLQCLVVLQWKWNNKQRRVIVSSSVTLLLIRNSGTVRGMQASTCSQLHVNTLMFSRFTMMVISAYVHSEALKTK